MHGSGDVAIYPSSIHTPHPHIALVYGFHADVRLGSLKSPRCYALLFGEFVNAVTLDLTIGEKFC
jgi:hypothetical protein